jgi:hypothetical protein
MDSNVLSTIAIVISILGVIIGVINHKEVKSRCCKKEVQFSLDINSTTESPKNNLSTSI